MLDLGGSGQQLATQQRPGCPLRVPGLPTSLRVAAVSAGYDHCVCVDSEGGVWSWGAKGHAPPLGCSAPKGAAKEGAAEEGAAEEGAAESAQPEANPHLLAEQAIAAAASPRGGDRLVLVAARLGGVGQLGRRVGAATGTLEALPAARAERMGRRVAHVAASRLVLK